jgi:hypothetical protein
MALTAAQINALFLAILQRPASSAERADWTTQDASVGDAAVINDIVTSDEAAQNVYPIIRIVQLVTGLAPTATQLDGWVHYEQSGGSLTSIVNAFAGSTNFQNVFNGGNPIDVNAPVNSTIMSNILEQTLGSVSSPSQVQAWVDTGLTVAQVLAQFVNGDQYSGKTLPFIENYLTTIADHAIVPWTGPPGWPSLFAVPSLITITDNTIGSNITEGQSITYTVTGIDIADGTTAHYSLGGATPQVNGSTAGILTFHSNVANLTVNTVANVLGGPPQGLTLTVSGGTLNPGSIGTDTVTITEAQQTISGTTPINESTTGSYTLTTDGHDVTLVGVSHPTLAA